MKLHQLFNEEYGPTDASSSFHDQVDQRSIGADQAPTDFRGSGRIPTHGNNAKKAKQIATRARVDARTVQAEHQDPVCVGRDKATLIATRTRLKAKRMNPKSGSNAPMDTHSRAPTDPSTGMGGNEQGTGLLS